MRNIAGAIMLAGLVSGCTVERIGPPGVAMTRPYAVRPAEVAVFPTADMVRGPFYIVEEVTTEDDGERSIGELDRDLRVQAGARGANAIILHPMNRRPNGTRVVIGLQSSDVFADYRATAIWLGDNPPRVRNLGGPGQ